MRPFLVALAALSASLAAAQPVTEAEFYKACGLFEDAHRRTLGMPKFEGRPSGTDKPVSRAAVAAELARVFQRLRPKVRLTPRPYRVDRALIDRRNSGKAREELALLVRWGLVAPVGPLVAGPAETLTVAEAGDAIGYFFSQATWLTQTPSKRWTPSLMPVEQDG